MGIIVMRSEQKGRMFYSCILILFENRINYIKAKAGNYRTKFQRELDKVYELSLSISLGSRTPCKHSSYPKWEASRFSVSKVDLWERSGGIQGQLLNLCSGIILVSAWRTMCGARNQIGVTHMY